jgi:rod shape-determining protein MreD
MIRFALFILIQVYVLDKIPHLHKFIIPYIYYLFILWVPYNTSRLLLLAIGFFTGLALDYFKMTPGLHAAACVLIAYIRPKDTTEFSHREPSPKGMGWSPYLVYVLILTLLHHFYLTFLEWLQFGSFLSFILKALATSAISMLLIITTELLFPRRMKYRTNTI